DFTWSCTREACTFRNHYGDIDRYGASIIGISDDDLESHKRFAQRYRLNFPLASDTSMDVCQQYGAVWLGGVRIKRLTFVVDQQGLVRGKFHHELFVDRHRRSVVMLLKKLHEAHLQPEGTLRP
ncbi:MAG: peroxiredoxin, partial [Bacteroidota bacterium]